MQRPNQTHPSVTLNSMQLVNVAYWNFEPKNGIMSALGMLGFDGELHFYICGEDAIYALREKPITANTSFEDAVADLKAFAREQLEGAFASRAAYAFA